MSNPIEVLENWSELCSNQCVNCEWGKDLICCVPGGVYVGRTISGIPGMTVGILLGNLFPWLRTSRKQKQQSGNRGPICLTCGRPIRECNGCDNIC